MQEDFIILFSKLLSSFIALRLIVVYENIIIYVFETWNVYLLPPYMKVKSEKIPVRCQIPNPVLKQYRKRSNN